MLSAEVAADWGVMRFTQYVGAHDCWNAKFAGGSLADQVVFFECELLFTLQTLPPLYLVVIASGVLAA